jgi:hypothetical protein
VEYLRMSKKVTLPALEKLGEPRAGTGKTTCVETQKDQDSVQRAWCNLFPPMEKLHGVCDALLSGCASYRIRKRRAFHKLRNDLEFECAELSTVLSEWGEGKAEGGRGGLSWHCRIFFFWQCRGFNSGPTS